MLAEVTRTCRKATFVDRRQCGVSFFLRALSLSLVYTESY